MWHVHDDTDEFFLVLDGRFAVVPHGIEHEPTSPGGSILMFEPTGTSSTGDRQDGDIPDHVDSTAGHRL